MQFCAFACQACHHSIYVSAWTIEKEVNTSRWMQGEPVCPLCLGPLVLDPRVVLEGTVTINMTGEEKVS